MSISFLHCTERNIRDTVQSETGDTADPTFSFEEVETLAR